MRKVIVWNMMTLDGYFEGSKPWEIDTRIYKKRPDISARTHFGRRLANKTSVLDNNACRILRAYAFIVRDWAMRLKDYPTVRPLSNRLVTLKVDFA